MFTAKSSKRVRRHVLAVTATWKGKVKRRLQHKCSRQAEQHTKTLVQLIDQSGRNYPLNNNSHHNKIILSPDDFTCNLY